MDFSLWSPHRAAACRKAHGIGHLAVHIQILPVQKHLGLIDIYGRRGPCFPHHESEIPWQKPHGRIHVPILDAQRYVIFEGGSSKSKASRRPRSCSSAGARL